MGLVLQRPKIITGLIVKHGQVFVTIYTYTYTQAHSLERTRHRQINRLREIQRKRERVAL